MPERESGEMTFSNPLPPEMMEQEGEAGADGAQPMTNEDFRKLMMTPRVPASSRQTPSASTSAAMASSAVKATDEEEDSAAKRRKKKSFYAKLKKQEEERQKELAEKYRDRALERRDGTNVDYEQTEVISTTADYRAVAPDVKAGENYAEKRKQLIQESKYLGGDMEHTHLVKGLDFALLEKVRAEITTKEQEDEVAMEMAVAVPPDKQDKQQKKQEEEEPETQIQFRTKMGRNIYRIVFKSKPAQRNELFLPRRMAYVCDLEDEFNDSDIPTTLIRSKADCPSLESTTTLTTNDIVIQKLTQILSYLRQGRREPKKLKKKDKGKQAKEEERPKLADDSIYGEMAGDYLSHKGKDRDRRERGDRDPKKDRDRERGERDRDYGRDRHDRERERGGDRDRDRGRHDRDRDRERDREREDREERDWDRKRSYFEKPADEDEYRHEPKDQSTTEFVQSINDRFKGWEGPEVPKDPEEEQRAQEEAKKKKKKPKPEVDSYAECYPGMMESADAIDDSDDEVDYTKMDQGNKKGPVGRWDFDTQEEYSSYMSSKEALPKAAFQYGVKMVDGRKTRRTGPKDEKRELDKEWQKIQNIMQKRKQMGTEGDRYSKQARY